MTRKEKTFHYQRSAKMDFDVRQCDLHKLNSATKYPSIPTYHDLDPKNGNLLEESVPFEGTVLATEKVDGTNSRMIFLPDGSFILGSREELLYAEGDLIGNPALGIVTALKEEALRVGHLMNQGRISVLFCEVYGGKVTGASKQYTGSRNVGFRMFDVVQIDDYESLLCQTPSQISSWREHGGQSFLNEDALIELVQACDFEVTPRILEINASDLPASVEDGLVFLQNSISKTLCMLDDSGGGQPEGLVVRAKDRSSIAKLRFQDYQRTIKRRKLGK